MTPGPFGWSYPPGCSGPPDDDGPCKVCGKWVDDCICPECPECGEVGRPDCYPNHLQMSEEQKESMKQAEKEWEAQAKAECDALADLHKEQNEL